MNNLVTIKIYFVGSKRPLTIEMGSKRRDKFMEELLEKDIIQIGEFTIIRSNITYMREIENER